MNPQDQAIKKPNDRYGVRSSYLTSSMKPDILGNELLKKIVDKVKRNKINLYQVLCEFDSGEGKEVIYGKDLPIAMSKIGIEIKNDDLNGLLMVMGIKDHNKVNIKDFAQGIALYKE
jgi:hypothetical protein